jgi:hypothetical protein
MRIFHDILTFERKFNKKREELDKNVIYFGCHKKRYTIHSYFFSSHLKSNDDNTHQEKKDKYPKDCYKGKRKDKVMNTIWDVNLDDDNNDSANETSQSQEINFTLIAIVEDISRGMDVETIIATKNITDPIIIMLLHKIIESKNPKTQSHHEEMIKVAPSTTTPKYLFCSAPFTAGFQLKTAVNEFILQWFLANNRCKLSSGLLLTTAVNSFTAVFN